LVEELWIQIGGHRRLSMPEPEFGISAENAGDALGAMPIRAYLDGPAAGRAAIAMPATVACTESP
jgi:hypothetical protein